MTTLSTSKPSALLVILAFAIVYIVWGSTYFFIQMAVHDIPPLILGGVRFTLAGILLLGWCAYKGDNLFVKKDIKNSAISGLLLLFIGNGIVIWVERVIPSAMTAIMVAANPIWFVLLDRVNWKVNLKNKATVAGIITGFAGVMLLFGEAFEQPKALSAAQVTGLVLLIVGPIGWSLGSLYSKKHGSKDTPARVNTGWQMLAAGLAFIPAGFIHGEYSGFNMADVSLQAWIATIYLIIFGSIVAFSAYVWLLKVRPATQVSTHSYVNPVIAVLLGVLFAGEHISFIQVIGLVVILVSVLLVNLNKYSFKKPRQLSAIKKMDVAA